MPPDALLKSVQRLSAKALEQLLQKRQAEDKALRVLWRAAIAREREERRQGREAADAD
ncbi:MAG TPA: hypothetical protein VKE94_22655 [Gemmataceae bacterium]|nr:hypothetical protein [Gemmataceae bacterium]